MPPPKPHILALTFDEEAKLRKLLSAADNIERIVEGEKKAAIVWAFVRQAALAIAAAATFFGGVIAAVRGFWPNGTSGPP